MLAINKLKRIFHKHTVRIVWNFLWFKSTNDIFININNKWLSTLTKLNKDGKILTQAIAREKT